LSFSRSFGVVVNSEVVDRRSGVLFRATFIVIYQVVAGADKSVKARVKHACRLQCLSMEFGVIVRPHMQVPSAHIHTTATVNCRHMDNMETSVI
jgi:hypothetical protein